LALVPAGEAGNEPVFLLRLAFPRENFGGSLAMLMTALVGNDVSTALRTRLVDLELSGAAAEAFPGPKTGIGELRALAGVKDRPLVLNMIKPCSGFTPEEGAKLFLETAMGGVDLIKDDELLGSPAYNPVAKRTALYLKAARQAREISGRLATYFPNISGPPKQMRDNARAVADAGGKACLVNFVFAGLDALAELADEFGDRLFIMAHYAGVGAMGWERGGIANSVFIGTLPRLAGAHAVMTMFPNRSDAAAMHDFYRTVQAQRLPMRSTRPILTAVGGGVTPVNQVKLQEELGPDLIIGIGGAIQGHPLGTTVGARTAMAAVEATAKGIPLEEAAVGNEGLHVALETWA
ncbi:MAG: transcriptional regulator, partial [Planctomycetota bacterium]|nr:transcriptional regulator [Planctomycetota bacterium]